MKSEVITNNDFIPNLNKVVAAALSENTVDDPSISTSSKAALLSTKISDLSPVIDFLEGKHCLTGVSEFVQFSKSLFFYQIIHVQ